MPSLEQRLEKAKRLAYDQQNDKAYNLLSKLVDTASKNKDPLLAALLNWRGIQARMLGLPAEAFKDYTTALQAADKSGNIEEKAHALVNIADIYRLNGNYMDAYASIDKALKTIKEYPICPAHAKALDFLGLTFASETKYDAAIKAYGRASTLCQKLIRKDSSDWESKDRLAQVEHHLGVAIANQGLEGHIEKAAHCQLGALRIFKGIQDRHGVLDKQGIVNATRALGNLARSPNDYAKALGYYVEAEQILGEKGYGRAVASLQLDFAEAYLALGDRENASGRLLQFSKHAGKLDPPDYYASLRQFAHVKDMYFASKLNVPEFEKIIPRFSKCSQSS